MHAAGVQKFIGTDHDVFLEILGKQSRAQIQVQFHERAVDRGYSIEPWVLSYSE